MKKQFKSAIESKKPHVVPVLQGWWKIVLKEAVPAPPTLRNIIMYRTLCYLHGAAVFASDTVAEELVFLREILETMEDMR